MNERPPATTLRSRSSDGLGGPVSTVANLTRGWTALYTHGVAAEVRDRRREEIDGDLTEGCREAAAAGRASLGVSAEILGRLVRGMPADIAWRWRMEGPIVSITMSPDRGMGVLFLATIVLTLVAGTIAGYDTSVEGWEREMRRIAGNGGTGANSVFQVVAGLGLIATAAMFFHLLRQHDLMLATVSGFGLAAAGLLALCESAMYAVMVALSQQWVADPSEALGDTARAFAIGMAHFAIATITALVASVGVMALVAARARLTPRWANWLAATGIVLFVGGITVEVIAPGSRVDEVAWIAGSLGFLLAIVWLLVTGIVLVGGARSSGRGTALTLGGTLLGTLLLVLLLLGLGGRA